MALSQDKDTARKHLDVASVPVAATTTIYAGAMVCVNAAGYAVPASDTANLSAAIGRAEEQIDNSAGANGDESIRVRRGRFKLENDGGNPVTQADQHGDVYVADDETVAVVGGVTNNIVMGRLEEIDEDGNPWVRVGV